MIVLLTREDIPSYLRVSEGTIKFARKTPKYSAGQTVLAQHHDSDICRSKDKAEVMLLSPCLLQELPFSDSGSLLIRRKIYLLMNTLGHPISGDCL